MPISDYIRLTLTEEPCQNKEYSIASSRSDQSKDKQKIETIINLSWRWFYWTPKNSESKRQRPEDSIFCS